MKHSLRTRLSLLVLAALACTVGPILFLVYRDVGETTLNLEKASFADLLFVEEESLNAGYMNLLANKVASVRDRKRQLRDAAAQAAALAHDLRGLDALPDASRAALEKNFLRHMSTSVLWVGLFEGTALAGGRAELPGLDPDARDAKGRTLAGFLDRLPADGDFAVFDLPLALREENGLFAPTAAPARPTLMFALPADVPGGSAALSAPLRSPDVPPDAATDGTRAGADATGDVVLALAPLLDLEEAAAASERAVIRAAQEKFSTLGLYEHGFIALLDGEGRTLAAAGTPPTDVSRLAPHLERSRAEGRTEARLPSGDPALGDMLYLFAHSPAFDWHVVTAAPLAEIAAPTTRLLIRLLMVAGVAALLAAALALTLLARALRPLGVLTRKTQALPDMDFASPETERLIARDLPLDRADEVGQLARAFARMGGRLSANIRALMETTASKERMEGELQAAREIQMGILPPPDGAPDVFGFTASAFLDPAKEVGGDLYDFFTTPDGRRALVLGDVSGKGVPAALFMSMTVTLVRYALRGGLDPAAAMTRINALLEEHNPGNMFVTLFLALYDPQNGDLEYANGGHCPPYAVQAAPGSPVRALEGLSGPLVGVMPDVEYVLFHDRLAQGELCLLFTDGVTEAMNESGELYGEERLQAFLDLRRADGPRDLLGATFADLVRYRGAAAPSDDITMLAFARR